MAFRQRSALVRATVRHGKELALEVEDDEFAAPHLDELASPRRDIAGRCDYVFATILLLRAYPARFPPPQRRRRSPCSERPRPSLFFPPAPALRECSRVE